MGLFERAGRKVERFRQAATEAAEEEATHECVDCGERYYADREACEECGGEVVPLGAADADAEGDDADADSGADAADGE